MEANSWALLLHRTTQFASTSGNSSVVERAGGRLGETALFSRMEEADYADQQVPGRRAQEAQLISHRRKNASDEKHFLENSTSHREW